MAKSVTAPIAMGIAERVQASPTLTAIFAVSTGILDAVLGRYVLDALRITAWWQRGFALGVAAHGIGTSRAFIVTQRLVPMQVLAWVCLVFWVQC